MSRLKSRAGTIAVLGLMVGGVVALTGGPTATAAAQSQTFSYTGAPESFQVPAGVTAIQVDAFGAEGGTGGGADTAGGLGGRATSVVCVTPGETLQVYVGGQGESGVLADALESDGPDSQATRDGVTAAAVSVGGFNGGGDALDQFSTGGAGGGASDVRRGAGTLADRLVVAGGGGGSGAENGDPGGEGGAGGGLAGGDGAISDGDTPGGGGGTQTAGGLADTSFDPSATNGALGQGGTGGEGTDTNDGGAGGGGGYYGGGGGAGDSNDSDNGGGGGGGSGFGPAGVVFETGTHTGDGLVTITWDPEDVSAVCLAPRFTG